MRILPFTLLLLSLSVSFHVYAFFDDIDSGSDEHIFAAAGRDVTVRSDVRPLPRGSGNTVVTQFIELRRVLDFKMPVRPSFLMSLMPGLGQAALGERGKAMVFAGIFTGSTLASVLLFVDAYWLRDHSIKDVARAEESVDYHERMLIYDEARNSWDDAQMKEGLASGLAIGAAALWLCSFVDYHATFHKFKRLGLTSAYGGPAIVFRSRI